MRGRQNLFTQSLFQEQKTGQVSQLRKAQSFADGGQEQEQSKDRNGGIIGADDKYVHLCIKSLCRFGLSKEGASEALLRTFRIGHVYIH